MAAVCLLSDVLNDREKTIFSLRPNATCLFEDSQLKMGRNILVFNHQDILKINMFLLLNEPISINKPFEIDDKNVWKFFEEHPVMSIDNSSIDLVVFNIRLFEVFSHAVFYGAVVPRNRQIKDKTFFVSHI